MKSLSTTRIIILVKFVHESAAHMIQVEDIAELVKMHNTYGIDYIKEYDHSKQKFIRVSKDQVYRWVSFRTEAVEVLVKAGYLPKKYF